MSRHPGRRAVRRPRRRVASRVLPLLALVALAGVLLVQPGHDADPSATSSAAPTSGTAVLSSAPVERAVTPGVPPIGHVFVINIENKGFSRTWGSTSPAPYLAVTLRGKGVLLTQYYGTAHHSLGNYLAQISGQGPTTQIQADCRTFSTFVQTATVAPGQAVGSGCVYPDTVRTLPRQLTRNGLTWKGYMEDMVRPCQHPALDTLDPYQRATATDYYATRHNPFMYFRSIIDRPTYCRNHVVRLGALPTDLQSVATTPNLVYITPDLCNDGHDVNCGDGRPGGLASVNTWMKRWVPRILQSPAFQQDGLLVITADEADADASACCGEGASANTDLPGITGPGGGRVGALLISPYITGGTTSATPYNHYSLLASLADIYGVARIGYARSAGVTPFGADVYTAWTG